MGAMEVLNENACSQEEIDYLLAYRYGLRRCYHGDEFGSDDIVAAMIRRGGATKDGFNDGLAGKPIDWSRFVD